MIPIPATQVAIREANLGWVQTAYTNTLLNALDAHVDTVEGRLSDVWAAWEREQTLLWGQGFDLVTALGYTNVMTPYKEKEFAYERSLYRKFRTVLSEALRTKNLRLYVSAKFGIEKQRQSDYLTRAKQEQQRVKYQLDADVAHNEAVLKRFDSEIEREATRLKQSVAAIERAERDLDFAVKLLTAQGELLTAEARNELERQKASFAIAKAALDVKLANLEAEKNKVRAEVVKADIKRLQSQVRVTQAETMVEEGRRYDILADIATIEAQAREIEILQAELALIEEQVRVYVEIADAKQNAFAGILTEKSANLTKLEQAQEKELSATMELADRMEDTATAKNVLEVVNQKAKLADEESRANIDIAQTESSMADLLNRGRLNASESSGKIAELMGRAKLYAAELRSKVQELLDKARLDAAESRIRLSAQNDRARLSAAETISKLAEMTVRADLDQADFAAKMSGALVSAELSDVEALAKLTNIINEGKLAASRDATLIAELTTKLSISSGEVSAAWERESARHTAQMLMLFLENYVRDVQAQIEVMATTDQVEREALRLLVDVEEAAANAQAAQILKEAIVENEITEIRE